MKIAKRFFLLSLLTFMVVMQSLIAAASPDNSSHIEQKAVVFVLDARACFKTRKLCAKCQYGKLII